LENEEEALMIYPECTVNFKLKMEIWNIEDCVIRDKTKDKKPMRKR